MNLGDWYREAEGLETEEIVERRNALQALREWETFNKEFKWTGIFTLDAILEYEYKSRIKRFLTSDGVELFFIESLNRWYDHYNTDLSDLSFPDDSGHPADDSGLLDGRFLPKAGAVDR